MKAKAFIFLLVFMIPAVLAAWPWKWNQLNKEGNRKGRWREYYDHLPNQIMYTGKYRNGKAKGVWRHFSPSGRIDKEEKYEPKKNRIKTTFFHSNGKMSHQGNAFLFEEDSLLKYQWHGDWHYNDSMGTWLGWKSFNRGRTQDAKPIKTRIGAISETEPENGN